MTARAPAWSPAPDPEAALLARLRRGEESAFAELTRTCGGRMLATARRLLRSDEDARDAVQEAFLSAFRSLDRFDGRSRLATWLHRIVVNAALMKLRSQRRHPEASIEELLPRFDESGGWIDAPHGAPPLADGALEGHEARTAVRRCIAALPESYRTILVLRDLEELEMDAVCRSLALSESAAKTRLHRARQALRTLLERDLQGTEPLTRH